MKRRDILKAICLSPLAILIPKTLLAKSNITDSIEIMKNNTCPKNGIAVVMSIVDKKGKVTEFGRKIRLNANATEQEISDMVTVLTKMLNFTNTNTNILKALKKNNMKF